MGFIHCNLRVLMAERGLNIKKVKEKTTLSRTTISNLYNNNGSGVQFDTMSELCGLFDCQPGDLFIYHDVNVNFEDVSSKLRTKITNTNMMKLTIDTKTSLRIDSEISEDVFSNNITVELDSNKKIKSFYGLQTPPVIEETVKENGLPFYVIEHIGKEYDRFIYERIEHYVKEANKNNQ